MILVDANLLIYAKFSDLPQHSVARTWLEGQLSTPGKVGIPWQTSLAFLRLSTNPRLFGRPLSIEAAWRQVTEWSQHVRVWIPEPVADHAMILGEILISAKATGNLVPDAHLAALAIGHGLTLCSTDSDFARFRGLTWVNPLSV